MFSIGDNGQIVCFKVKQMFLQVFFGGLLNPSKGSEKIFKEENCFKQIKSIFLLYCKYIKLSSRMKNI